MVYWARTDTVQKIFICWIQYHRLEYWNTVGGIIDINYPVEGYTRIFPALWRAVVTFSHHSACGEHCPTIHLLSTQPLGLKARPRRPPVAWAGQLRHPHPASLQASAHSCAQSTGDFPPRGIHPRYSLCLYRACDAHCASSTGHNHGSSTAPCRTNSATLASASGAPPDFRRICCTNETPFRLRQAASAPSSRITCSTAIEESQQTHSSG